MVPERDAEVAPPAALDALEVEARADEDFVEVYRRHYPRLVRALRLSGAASEAEDLAQEAFARTLVHWWRVRRGTNPAGYPYRVAFRLARRARRAGGERLLHGEEPVAVTTGDGTGMAALRADLERALERMPPARRRCAVLSMLVGLSPVEVGRALRIAPSTVRKQVSLARAALVPALGVEAVPPGVPPLRLARAPERGAAGRGAMGEAPAGGRTWRYRFTRPGGEEAGTGEFDGDEAAEAHGRELSKAEGSPIVVERRGMVDWDYVTEVDERP